MKPFPNRVFVATVTGGVYYTSTFTSPDSAVDPIWSAINNGLPDDAGQYNVVRFWLDPLKPERYQYAHIIQGSGGVGDPGFINTVYIREYENDWIPLITLEQALLAGSIAYPSTATPRESMRMSVDQLNGVLQIAVWGGNAPGGDTGDRANSVLRSVDRGENWSRVGFMDYSLVSIYGVRYPYYSFGNLSAASGMASNGFSYKSANGGSSWQQSTGPSASSAITLVGVDKFGNVYGQYPSLTGTEIALVGYDGAAHVVQEYLPDATDLYGDVTAGGFGGLWISRTSPGIQWVLRRKNATDDTQELWQTTNSWKTATKLAEIDVISGDTDIYRRALRKIDNDISDGRAILGFRQPSNLENPDTVFAWDALSGNQPVGKSGGDPVGGVNSIPVSAGGVIDDGVWYLYDRRSFIGKISI